MRKRSFWFTICLFGVLVAGLNGCNGKDLPKNVSENKRMMVDANVSLCEQVPAEIVGNALGMKVVNTKLSDGNITNTCDYYTDEKNWITVRLNRLNFENQKTGQSGMDEVKIETDPKIGAEHFIVIPPVDKMISITIKVEENLLLTVENGLSEAYSRPQVIDVAAAIVDFLASGENNTLKEDKRNDEEIDEKNLSDDGNVENKQELVEKFFTLLSKKDIQGALTMMDADNNTKQAWGVNFNTIEKIELKNISEVYKEEWTDVRQSYKVELDVKVTPAGEEVGWQNGVNYRWVTLQVADNGRWLIYELANNP